MTLPLSEHLPLIASAPDGIQKLRSLILELAVRGKLLRQDPNDEPASKLLFEIENERHRLDKAGVRKKTKSAPTIDFENQDFAIPDSWAWVSLATLLERMSNGYSGRQSKVETPYPLTRIETISKGEVNFNKTGYCVDIGNEEVQKFRLYPGDILLSHINSDFHVGKTALYTEDRLLIHGINLLLLRPFPICSSSYIDLAINWRRLNGYFLRIAQHAIGQSSINKSKLSQVPIPLPPISEQHRIVAKVDELMVLCDRLESEQNDSAAAHAQLVETLLCTLTQSTDATDFEANWKRIAEHFDTLFSTEASIHALQKTILQLAVMGKLVPQDSMDEPADDLLIRLSNVSGRTKSIPQVLEDEHPFVIPDSWVWCRVATLGNTQTGTTPSKSEPSLFGTDYPFIKPGDISVAGAIDYDNEGLSNAGVTASGRLADSKSILMVCIGTIGKCGQIDRPCSFNQQINSVTPMEGTSDFALLALQSPYFQIKAWERSSSTTLSILNKGKWESIPLPLPPLAEQQRIVAKVNELMSLCDSLKNQLAESRQQESRLADTLIQTSLKAA